MSYFICRRLIRLRPTELITRATSLSFYTCTRLSSCGELDTKRVTNVNTEQFVSKRAGIKVPRFLRKMKDEEQINRYCMIKSLCMEKNFGKATCYMKKWLEEDPVSQRQSTILILNGLLYSLFEQGRMEDITLLKHKMDTHKITGDRSTYVVLIDGFGKMKNAEKVSELIREITSLGLVPHERSYIVAAELAMESRDFLEAVDYFLRIESVYKEVHDDFCGWFIGCLIEANQGEYIVNIFNDFRKNRTRMGEKTLVAIKKYFESSFSNGKWETNLTKISSSGECKKCHRKLEETKFGKQEVYLKSYFRYLINQKLKGETSGRLNALSQHDSVMKDENQLLELNKYLKRYGPFHVVVDGLNVAMHSSHSVNFYPLCRLAEYFTNQGKRVLVMAANDLISPKKSTTVSIVEHKKAMMRLKTVSNVYLVKQSQSGIDDLFLIYAALCSSRDQSELSDVQLVSNDKFLDHQLTMKPQTASDFNHWLRAHQVILKGYDRTSGKPLLDCGPKYALTVQKTRDSWHFPSTDNETWLCAERR